MIHIIPCNDRFDELVHFVTRLNSEGVHHIGFFGEGEADIRASLAECLILPAEGFLMAYEGDRLVGAFGVDADPEINRVWLFGPLVEHADWHLVADQLYEAVLPRIPAELRDRDMFCDVQNVHIKEFAARHDYALLSENAVLTLAREKYTPSAKRTSQVIVFEDRFFDEFEKLHNELFPNTYLTARQIVEKRDNNHRLFLAIDDERLLGYHFCKVEPESGYVDFIGTDASARGRGIGADLLASGIDWMFAAPTTKQIGLTVNADNTTARTLYEKFGFVVQHIMRGYRKQIV